MRIFVIPAVALLLSGVVSSNSRAQDVLVFSGVPVARSSASIEDCSYTVLADEQREESRLVIMKTQAGYQWSSRENRPLIPQESDEFTYFIEPSGAGYITIEKGKDNYVYMEHISLGLETLTYWGMSDGFK